MLLGKISPCRTRHCLRKVRWVYGCLVLRADGSCGDRLRGAHRCGHLRSAAERWRPTGNGHADCELPVRSANTPDRHIQPEGGLDGAELDAVAVWPKYSRDAAGTSLVYDEQFCHARSIPQRPPAVPASVIGCGAI